VKLNINRLWNTPINASTAGRLDQIQIQKKLNHFTSSKGSWLGHIKGVRTLDEHFGHLTQQKIDSKYLVEIRREVA
jgi:hypothetical protein